MVPPQHELPADLISVTRRLGSKDTQVQANAAQTLREAGEAGLNALLAVWNEKEKKNIPLGTGRVRRQMAIVMADFDDPRVILPLAQSLPLLTIKSPEREKVLANLRRQLMREPSHTFTFPTSRYVLRCVPDRPQRQIRLFWFWLTCEVMFLPMVLVAEWFLPLFHGGFGGAISSIWGMPIVFTTMAAIGQSAMKEDVAFERIPLRLQKRVLVYLGISTVLFLIGLITRLLTGYPEWYQILSGSIAVPVGFLCAGVISKRAIIEPLPAPEISPEGVWPPAPRKNTGP